MQKLKPDYQKVLDDLLKDIKKHSNSFLGYPVSKDFNFEDLSEFLNYPMNNLGDPFVGSTYQVGSRNQETEVIAFFADLFRAPIDNFWGYVTNGGSEGNLYGLYLARELHPKAMVYYSEATHYSVHKNLHLLGLQSIVIKTQDNGEIDYDDLRLNIGMNRHLPAIIMANIGTTMTEARDDIYQIRSILKNLAIQKFYIHADAALSGVYSAFIKPRPAFDFADGADSIAISGHKFLGSPMPCGVVIVKRSNKDRIARTISYIGSMDTTITGSRNGHTPLFLWYSIKTLGIEGLKSRAMQSLMVAEYATNKLMAAGIDAWRNPHAITVNFPSPPLSICQKWQLASEDSLAHIICMPNVSTDQIDQFVLDMKEANREITMHSAQLQTY
ncbi:histidine decarboxylase [Pedobacter frigidisoli]|uniref:histidine decarboxylase n=1 Tax=Pedobacter frigidisoli TaxID=2530455 RepID=UPI00292DC9DD|nr:histidine decarboxylase [Pedobacter frigidisoli]